MSIENLFKILFISLKVDDKLSGEPQIVWYTKKKIQKHIFENGLEQSPVILLHFSKMASNQR